MQNSEASAQSCDVETAIHFLPNLGRAVWVLLSWTTEFLGHLQSDFCDGKGSMILDVIKWLALKRHLNPKLPPFTLWSTAILIWIHWAAQAASSKCWFSFLVSQTFQLPGNCPVRLGRHGLARRREASLLSGFLSPCKASLLPYENKLLWSLTELRNVPLMSLDQSLEQELALSQVCISATKYSVSSF